MIQERKTTISIYRTAKVELIEYRDLKDGFWWNKEKGVFHNYYISDCFGSYSQVCKELVNLLFENDKKSNLHNEIVIKELILKNGN